MSVGKLATLDAATQARLESACSFVTQKIQLLRRRVLTVGALCLTAAFLITTFGHVDFRFPLGGAVLITFLTAAHAQSQIKKWYKTLVVGRVVQALGNGLTYSAESSFTRD